MEDPVSPPKPPRPISDCPSASKVKFRNVFAIREWPPGLRPCPPSSDQQPSPSQLVVETGFVSNDFEDSKESNFCERKELGSGVEKCQNEEVDNGFQSSKRWFKSSVYPPLKRRAVFAIREFPPGCGPNLGLSGRRVEIETSNKEIDQQEKDQVFEIREFPPGCGAKLDLRGKRVETETNNKEIDQQEEDKVSNQIVLLQENDDAMISLQSDTASDEMNLSRDIHSEDSIREVENKKFKGKAKIFEGEGSSKKKKKKYVEISDDVESNSDEEFLISEDKSFVSEDKFVISEDEFFIREDEEVLDIKSSAKLKSQQSKELVLFDENNQEESRNKDEKVVMKKTVPSKKAKSNEKLKGQIEEETNTNTATVLFEEHDNEEDDTEFYEDAIRSIAKFSKCRRKPAKKSNAGPSNSLKKRRNSNSKSTKKITSNKCELTSPPISTKSSSDTRSKIKTILRNFQVTCRKLSQEEESKFQKQLEEEESTSRTKSKSKMKKDRVRIDLKAGEIIKRTPEYTDPGKPVVGTIPGIEVGDEFRYRMELHLIGLHHPLQSGIDSTELNGVRVATSIVSSGGGYSDKFNSSGVLIYTGSGGKPNGNGKKRTEPDDQKLEKGNLALKNSMDLKLPVRVIHGANTSDKKRFVIMNFTYDGLYMVESYQYVNETFPIGKDEHYTIKVYKFKLRRIEGQPELGLHVAAKSMESEEREGLVTADISRGREKMPICAINTVDDEEPPNFEYVTNLMYPSWYEETPPKGCNCIGKCSNLKYSKKCACSLKNGGNLPYNSNGLIIEARNLVYECGPTCKCPPSCPNRVSQNGITVSLEIFKTESRGWGVRSLSSISSGSFICEYVGELFRDEEAEQLEKDEYLFDIGKSYEDALKGGAKCERESETEEEEEGFTIDAAKMGNVGRFINHSCSPNLYAQNVLFDHGDKRMPHVMFFAAENIPPLQELTYYYNYKIGEVLDNMGNEKRKDCYCGSSECDGRLY